MTSLVSYTSHRCAWLLRVAGINSARTRRTRLGVWRLEKRLRLLYTWCRVDDPEGSDAHYYRLHYGGGRGFGSGRADADHRFKPADVGRSQCARFETLNGSQTSAAG
jgi:hypothetical protein